MKPKTYSQRLSDWLKRDGNEVWFPSCNKWTTIYTLRHKPGLKTGGASWPVIIVHDLGGFNLTLAAFAAIPPSRPRPEPFRKAG